MAGKKGNEAGQIMMTVQSADETTPRSGQKPLVFVSHDSRDAELAEAFGNLLADVSGGTLKSFRSSDRKGTTGIEFGAEWYKSIMDNLGSATDVVALLTPHSIDRPWILYEAGVAKGKLDTTVFGLAVGVPLEKASIGPFAQFQNSGDDEDSITKLVLQLIRRNPDAAPREEAVRRQVQAFRQNMVILAKGSAKTSAQPRIDETSVARLFEEIKVMVRDLPRAIESTLGDTAGSGRIRRRFPVHPALFEHLFRENARGPDGQANSYLLLAGLVREELPWVSEAALEVYRALNSNDPNRIDLTRRGLLTSLQTTRRDPAIRDFLMRGKDRGDLYFFLEVIEDLVRRPYETKQVEDEKDPPKAVAAPPAKTQN